MHLSCLFEASPVSHHVSAFFVDPIYVIVKFITSNHRYLDSYLAFPLSHLFKLQYWDIAGRVQYSFNVRVFCNLTPNTSKYFRLLVAVRIILHHVTGDPIRVGLNLDTWILILAGVPPRFHACRDITGQLGRS
jgi:hypothetical protein